MLIGISIALIITATFAAAIFSLSQRNFSFNSIAREEKGLSTLEWILLVAAVGGLATAGVIIVRNAVGGAGDQVDDTARTERLAQRDVNQVMRTKKDGTVENDNAIHYSEIRGEVQATANPSPPYKRCSFDYRLDDGSYPLRKWRGAFTLKDVQHTLVSGTIAYQATGISGVSNTQMNWWCDAVPTNNLANNPANFAGPIRTNITAGCIRWPDGDAKGVISNTNKPCT